MKNDEKRFLLKYTKNTIKICISIQNFNNAKKIQKMENCQNARKFYVIFVENHKMLIAKMHKNKINKKVFLCKIHKLSKNRGKFKKTY